jgi:hypothetical protein
VPAAELSDGLLACQWTPFIQLLCAWRYQPLGRVLMEDAKPYTSVVLDPTAKSTEVKTVALGRCGCSLEEMRDDVLLRVDVSWYSSVWMSLAGCRVPERRP